MAARKAKYEVDHKNKIVTKYEGVTLTESEKQDVLLYVAVGYELRIVKPINNKSVTVKQMREELKADEETLKEFEETYKDKEKGFFEACKIYNAWKKKNK